LHHLVELLLCDLAPSVPFSEDVVGLVAVSPVSARTISSPWPESPSDEPEDCEYPEETEEDPEWEEAVWIVAYRGWSEEEPVDCGDRSDYCYESEDSPKDESTRVSPLILTRLVCTSSLIVFGLSDIGYTISEITI
jgi:hypothetical protein